MQLVDQRILPSAEQLRLKKRTATLSLIAALVFTILKFIAALITGSAAVLAESFHSLTDIVTGALAIGAVQISSAPPDRDHPYGHSKVEDLGGLAEASLLITLSAFALIQSVRRLLDNEMIRSPRLGIIVVGACAVATLVVGGYIRHVGRKTHSMMLTSNGTHLSSDFWTSLFALLGLSLSSYFHLRWIDAVCGLAIGLWLGATGAKIGHESVENLMDRSLPETDVEEIERMISSSAGVISFHKLRTRMSGSVRYIEFHVVVPNNWSLIQAHDLADHLEHDIRERFRPASVVVHIDPYDDRKAQAGGA